MHRLFEIDYTLRHVIGFVLAKNDLLSLALTCSTVQRPALDLLWSNLDSVYPLIRLLGELELKETNSCGERATRWVFTNPLILKDKWKRWEVYSERVHSISLSASYTPGGSIVTTTVIAPEAVAQVGLSVPRDTVLLPSIRYIRLPHRGNSFTLWLPFLHQAEKEVRLRIEAPNEPLFDSLESILSEAERRIPKIVALEVEELDELEVWNPGLFRPLSEMSGLREVVLPPFGFQHLAASPSAAGSRLQKIRLLDLYHMNVPKNNPELRRIQEQNMENLVTFEVASTPAALSLLLEDTSWAPQLKELYLLSSRSQRRDIQDLVMTISRRRVGLTSIRLDFSHIAEVTTQELEYGDIRPLLDCKDVKTFWWRHCFRSVIQEVELEEMLKNWHFVEEIAISNDDPDQNCCFKLDILNMFAAERPRIRCIQLPFRDNGPLKCVPALRLENLQTLALGSSVPADVGETALYLSCICPQTVEWKRSQIQDPTLFGLHNKWMGARKLFDLFVRSGRRTYDRMRENELVCPKGWRVLPKPEVSPREIRSDSLASM